MKIEIKERGSEAFFKEAISAANQYRKIIRKPEKKLLNVFTYFRAALILGIIFLALCIALGVAWGIDALITTAIVLWCVVILISAVYTVRLNKMLKSLMEGSIGSVLTLDEAGIELEKASGTDVRLSWNNVLFARVFREALCFIPKEDSGIVISVSRDYEAQVLSYLRSEKPELRVYGI